MNDKKVLIELSMDELNLIILGITGSQFPQERQKEAFNLVLRLRDKLREAT